MTPSVTRKTGVVTLLQAARVERVLCALAKHAILMPLVFLPPLCWALAEQAWSFAAGLAVPILLGGAAWLAVYRVAMPDDLRQVEAVVVLALIFILTPVLAMPAFMTLGMQSLDALFEGMSGVTTTGLSVATNADAWPFAAHVLRSWLQWCGGLAMATAVLAMLIGPGATARKLGKVSLDDRDRLASTRNRARQLLGAYAGLTLVFAVLISASIGSVPKGLLLALSAVSTGGFSYHSDSVASYSVLTQTLTIVASLSGAVSLLAVALASKGDWSGSWELGSFQRVLIWAFGSVALICGFAWLSGMGAYYVTAWTLLSAISTAGFSVSDMPTASGLLLFFMGVMVIGGDVGSTAGGLKLARLSTLLRAGRHATRAPRLPDSAVAPMREHDTPVKADQLIALMALLLFYIGFTLALWTGFLVYDYPAVPALFDTVSAFSTVGLSTGVIGPDTPTPLKAATILAMLLGRLEFIAVLLLILPRTWHAPHQRS